MRGKCLIENYILHDEVHYDFVNWNSQIHIRDILFQFFCHQGSGLPVMNFLSIQL